jgi:hypothetical protein
VLSNVSSSYLFPLSSFRFPRFSRPFFILTVLILILTIALPTDIIAAYIIGIVLFAITLVPWTADTQSLYWRAPEAFWRAVVQGAA